MKESFKNCRPIHGVKFVDGQPTIVFDTICTKNKQSWLATNEVHLQLIETWKSATHWLVGRYVVMPDHIHLFAWATEESGEYDNWVRYWKSMFTKKHCNPLDRWQDNHWDRRIRNSHAYEEKWNYVRENPVRAGLVKNKEEWPYQGEVFHLRWTPGG